MGLLRLIALAAVAACGQASGQPSPAPATPVASGLHAPAGWTALPAVAEAIRASARPGVTVEGSEAWGEPARGCYGVWLALRGDQASAADVLASLDAEKITTSSVAKPETAEGLVTASFEKAPYKGQLRARVAAGRVTALACFANDREPASCQPGCTQLLGGLP